MSKATDIQITKVDYYLLPVDMRMPLKFGPESVSSVTCLRVAVEVTGADGRRATGWGRLPYR